MSLLLPSTLEFDRYCYIRVVYIKLKKQHEWLLLFLFAIKWATKAVRTEIDQ